jgi:hydroxymethylglutaryl-CoA reductase (NADPH)
VTLPNLMLGTVGGGTGLPSQSAGLRILGLHGANKAEALAEVVAVLCLAGEISIAAAFSAGHFGQAHKRLARDRR